MGQSSLNQLNAWILKNVLILKRNIFATIAEILFPIILMILVFGIRKAFKIEEHRFDTEEKTDLLFATNKSISAVSPDQIGNDFKFKGFTVLPLSTVCYDRPKIAIISPSQDDKENLKEKIQDYLDNVDKPFFFPINGVPWRWFEMSFLTDLTSVKELNDYIQGSSYGDTTHPKICFGIYFEQINAEHFNYSMHYFDSSHEEGYQDIPTHSKTQWVYDEFQIAPDIKDYKKYQTSGYMIILKIINEYILSKTSETIGASVNYAMLAQKYDLYQKDPFGEFLGFIVPFFAVIAYMCPLCWYVSRMVVEKETRAKEGMKIMGMSDWTYFLSYFIQYFITNIIYALINSFVWTYVFTQIPYQFLFAMFWLYGMNIFSLAFFFQSFIDKTRVAMILSLLIYFVMFFLSIAVFDEQVSYAVKILVSIFPPVGIELGVIVFGKFEGKFNKFKAEHINKKHMGYTVEAMYIMFAVDFFLYLFLGYYLQNIISHDFGISRPFYFLCTKTYWCGKAKKSNTNKALEWMENGNDIKPGELLKLNNPNQADPNFESEALYKDKTKKDDVLTIRNLRKVFGDKKVAVDGVGLNLFKDEIFALLGHNGAGKSTIISMLSGLYEATDGTALYDGNNIWDDTQMDIFRRKLGICPQHDVLFDDWTIKEHLNMFCYFKGVDKVKIEDEVNKTWKDFHVEDIQDIIARNWSAGQRRKLSIAIALIGGSEVIFWDEPSSGMDITSRRNLWEILKRCTEKKIIILTTHYMEEASVLGNRIGIIDDGKLKCIGTPLFLIERFGKYMSLNVYKEEKADNTEIIQFFNKYIPNAEVEPLSEEILFRIPKSSFAMKTSAEDNGNNLSINKEHRREENEVNGKNRFSLDAFFKALDDNMTTLKIKSYSAAMPTLEDVFLNVASMEHAKLNAEHRKFSEVNNDNDKILFETDFKAVYTPFQKYKVDLTSSLKKRLLQIFRDMKSFFLEVLCPIILIIIGLAVTQVKFSRESIPFIPNISELAPNQTIVYGEHSLGKLPSDFYLTNYPNVTSELSSYQPTSSDVKLGTIGFMNAINDKKYDDNLCSFYFLSNDTGKYEFVEWVNSKSRQAPVFCTFHILQQIINLAAGKEVKIEFTHWPMPWTAELQNHDNEMNNYTLVFFVAVAFSLIPANFITLIVKERQNNSKHWMKISGISLIAYWMSNYIFELLKYYVAGGINMLLIWAFDFFPSYLYILYILYGPAMVSFTYLLSFLFKTESGAQNGVILINFLFGALGSSIVLMFRSLDSLVNIGKGMAYAFRLVPSFCFGYGFNQLLNGSLLLYADHGPAAALFKKSRLLTLPYIGNDILYLGIETLVYLAIMIYLEKRANTFSVPSNDIIQSKVNDSTVQKEIDRANQEEKLMIADESGTTTVNNLVQNSKKEEVFSVKLQNLQKNYFKAGIFCNTNEKVEAVKNLSFCINYGECFGLLGVNGAGKTTTFKCLTQEHAASNGRIFINGIDTSEHFEEVRDMFGYCPQFDAIFEYMTVYENLEFYAKIKGVELSLLDSMITAMISEMSLKEYRDKVSGNLSGGNKRKLSVAISMICNPPIILLDEPSTGMDPEARRFMWAVIHKISTKRKKSSVIMTTHSMDEAETLCRRMGIMVNGEFICLGTSQSIKDKYGYGFEIDLRVMPLTESKMNEAYESIGMEKKTEINLDNVQGVLDRLKKKNFYNELSNDKIGKNVLREIQTVGYVYPSVIINWVYYVSSAMKVIKAIKPYFEEIIWTEFIENNFWFKIKKDENSKSIGFLFGVVEGIKDQCNITEYSIQQTSWEQIFNNFAAKQGKDKNVAVEMKTEIVMNDDLIKQCLEG